MARHVLKVFATPAERSALARRFRVVERYPGFILLAVPKDAVAAVRARYLCEDLTPQYRVTVRGRTLDLGRYLFGRKTAAGPAVADAARLSPGPHHYLLHFRGPVKPAWLEAVRRAGARLREPQGGFRYVVGADAAAVRALAALPCVLWLGHLPREDRVAVPAAPRRRHRRPLIVVFFDAHDARAGRAAIAALGATILATHDDLVVVAAPAGPRREELVRRLAGIHGVREVRDRPVKRVSNDVAAGIMGTAATLAAAGLGLSGAGEIVAVCDTGLDTGALDTLHPDFRGRVVGLRSYPVTPDWAADATNPGSDDGPADCSGHGTHVAGSAVGSGAAGAPRPRGLAFGARLFFQAVQQPIQWRTKTLARTNDRYQLAGIPADWTPILQDAWDAGARIHSDSWNGDEPGAYDAQARQLDAFVWRHPEMCVVTSAGNAGEDRDRDGVLPRGSVTSLATAKNCVAVGACESHRPDLAAYTYGVAMGDDFPGGPYHDLPMAGDPDRVAPFSAHGPASGGRVRPDLVAPGTYILSARAQCPDAAENDSWGDYDRWYWYMGGTSMATPLVAGAAALVRELLRRRGRRPSAALVKATLVAGAVRLPGYGHAGAVVDHVQGFGRVNLDAVLAPPRPGSVRFRDVKKGLQTGAVFRFTCRLSARPTRRVATLRVVLAYSDWPGHELVNNLNLVVRGPGGARHAGNQRAGAHPSLDATNNCEVVQVAEPAPGVWTIEIIAANVPRGPQPFAVVILAEGTRPPP